MTYGSINACNTSLRDLENGRGRGNEREGGLDAAAGVGGVGGLDELPLELEGGGSGSLEVAGDLLRRPLAAGAPANEGEDSHCLFFEKRT